MVTKITSPVTPLEVIGKVNEIIDDFTLDNLTNVSISSPSAGQNLTYDATNQVWKNTSSSATVAWGGITGTLSDQSDLNNALNGKVPTSRTINSKALTSDITLTASDVGALPDSTVIPAVDQTYDGTSANAQSGKAVASAISGKADDSDVVHKAGAETITGGKSFTQGTGNPYVNIIPAGGNIEIYGKNNNSGYIKFTRISGGDSYLTQNNGRLQVSSDGTNYYNIINSSDLATVATTGAYSDIIGAPSVNNATLTITQGGTTKGTFTANASSNVTIDLDSGGGSSRNIGEIIQSTIPLTDAGLHLLDGALINGSGSYADFVTYIAGLVSDYPDLFTTEANWQQAVTDYGVCGKFVYDSVNNTVRLPKITGFTEGTIDPTLLGNLTEAGLPNINGNTGINVAGYHPTGCFFADSTVTNGATASRGAYGIGIGIDASTSSSIYGNSTTVQPQSVKVLYYIVIATSTKTDIEVDIDEIATDLNGKADVDLSNVSNTAGFRKLVEVYNNGSSWYKVFREYNPSDGTLIGLWCEQGGYLGEAFATKEVTLLKPYVDTLYTITTANKNVSNSFGMRVDIVSNSVISFSRISSYNSTGWWKTSGYIQ